MATPPTENGTKTLFGYGTSITGTALPSWRAVIAGGGNATTSLTAWENTIRARPPSMRATYRYRPNALVPYELRESYDSSFINLWTITPISAHFSAAPDTQAQNQAVKELYAKIRRAHHQLQGGVILGEIDKTARLIAGTAKNLKQGVLKYIAKAVGIRRGGGTTGTKQKAIANSYLEATFGWQPLIGDCKDFAKTLGRLTHETDRATFTAVGEGQANTLSQMTSSNFWFLYLNHWVEEYTRTKVIYRGFIQGLPYEIGSPPLARIVTMSGFDLRSFVPTMWELVPYSFVVDYFTNIGDALYALSTDTSVVKGLWRTQIKESFRVIIGAPDIARSKTAIETNGSDVKNVLVEGSAGSILINKRDVTRSATSMPYLLPRLTGVDLPWRQFVNLGALISGKTAR